ncbi:hypothetical protein ACU5AX_00525 [Sphingomonas sp. XXL09]|uniref:hypothetical protein n=1 Tax=Sphingomonas sp. XXL09 TaxID=3457787 RepID=UPI00406BC06F
MITAMPPPLRATLCAVAAAMAADPDGWWIIGSAAVALHGGDAGRVRDVDLLVDANIVGGLLSRLGIRPMAMAPDPLFHSAVFARWDGLPLPVEVMAGFCVAVQNTWHDVTPISRQRIMVDGSTVFVPEREELLALLRLFGRPKDLARAGSLARREPG